jgi:hypothetical protein
MRVAAGATASATLLANKLTDEWPVVTFGWFALASHAGPVVDDAASRREYPE